MHLDSLPLEQLQKTSGQSGSRIIAGEDVGCRSFIMGLRDGPLTLEIKVFHEFLFVVGEIIHPDEYAALLEVDVVADRPQSARQRRVWPVPGSIIPVPYNASAPVTSPLCFVKTSDSIVTVCRVKSVIGRPSVIELVCPDTRHTLFGQFVDFLVGKLVPFVDNDGVEPGIVRSCAG